MSGFVTHLEILWPAMLAGLLVLSTHIPLGREVLNRGIIFLDLAIAQIAAFGVVFANTVFMDSSGGHDHAHVSPTLIAIITAIVGSLGLYKIRNASVTIQESIIGILFVLSATGIILLLSTDPHGGERLKEILVGQILWLQAKDLLVLFIASLIVLLVWHFLREKVGEWLFYPLFAVMITLATQVVGVYLVFASLIIPNLPMLKRSQPLIKAFILGALGYASGLSISALADLPAGATVVWSLAVLALFYFVVTRQQKPQQ